MSDFSVTQASIVTGHREGQTFYEIRKYCQGTSEAHAEALQNLVVRQQAAGAHIASGSQAAQAQASLGEGARFVKHHCVDRRKPLKDISTSDQQPPAKHAFKHEHMANGIIMVEGGAECSVDLQHKVLQATQKVLLKSIAIKHT